jgi:predicted DCC family thiol-disulfide oxidoreductase YuxK
MAAAGRSVSRRLAESPPYSYRSDAQVPRFPDDKGLIVFDGVCVLCTASARFVLKHDSGFAFRLTTVQSPLGQALFRHYGLDTTTFETNLVLVDGRAYGKLDSIAAVCGRIGGMWRLLSALRLLPRTFADWLYDRVAFNRYALFGRRDRCMIPPPEWRNRFLE